MEEQKFVILSEDVLNAVLGYFGSRPYTEVVDLINGVLNDIGKNKANKVIYEKPPQTEKPVDEAPIEVTMEEAEG